VLSGVEMVMSEEGEKSVLDGIPVQESDSFQALMGKCPPCVSFPNLTVVGHCPCCGSPIYGSHSIASGETPDVRRSCNCYCPDTPANHCEGDEMSKTKAPKAKVAAAVAVPTKGSGKKGAKKGKK